MQEMYREDLQERISAAQLLRERAFREGGWSK